MTAITPEMWAAINRTARKREYESQVPTLLFQLRARGLPAPALEHRFHAERRWRFDLAWPDLRFAVEVEGGVFARGKARHTAGMGYTRDCEKYAEALCLGWRVLRVTSEQVRSGQALRWIERALKVAEGEP